ncbi:type III secretion system export apparatus subunit SctR [Thalassomonas actiniarum]|uniref:Type III secretion system export apparatus subunit SctR n=1 Tax=Thalassomonas actiniarum TaxID=485447 RepID=A0AAE9YVW2_9GAMM|nr:type III secretion system export apparatus subunit SctR [Thalassomonas actiniarum]WDE02231.1 type III secretion system export apparatus subunit SctR [Thalassomonas actiniarum]
MSGEIDPILLIIGLSVLALVPFLAVMTTSFVKLAVVLGLLRNALGVQQIPPNMALHGLAIILTFYIMAPVMFEIQDIVEQEPIELNSLANLGPVIDKSVIPFKDFLKKHSNERERKFFKVNAEKLWPKAYSDRIDDNSLLILVPAFTVSELTSAFEIGFLLYLPFVAIDLIVSNILLAMGMMMVSPMTISLPFKLLLFVLLDGWARLIHGLVLTYM